MQIARPPSGFRVTYSDEVRAQLRALHESAPWLDQALKDLCERLKMTGHREGRPVASGRVSVEADPLTGRNRLGVVYTVLGDSLRVVSLKVVM